ncbi:MAG: thiamine pyrophosphate-dependent enzyme [Sphingomonadaceae bacterium]|nr:thiamine pyrophosphate-dependent enzyme [Sphingomonadaceae bacterium]
MRANQQPLSLHIPEPPARPGEAPDFSHIAVPPAGAMARPDIGTPASEMRDHVYGLIRVLSEDGKAVGPWDPKLSPEMLVRALRAIALTRIYDDRMYRVQRQGKTSFYMKSLGEEAVAVGAALALDDGDMCFPTYRQQGLLITRGCSLVTMMNQVYSNAADPLLGRQLPIMYSHPEYGFFSISGNLATQYPQAVGWAMASAYAGDTRIAAAWIGEGSTAENDFHSACTFATVYRAPVILNVVNNQWAISSYSGIAGGDATTFAARALAYGLPGLRVDGNDLLAVYAATEWAAERARANLGPTLIELFTYRAEGHSTSDDPTRYRPAQEGQAWPLGDPLERLKQHLVTIGAWDDARHEAMIAELTAQVRSAGREAEANGTLGTGPGPDPATMFDGIFRDIPPHIAEQKREAGF